jgi:hypothetical protein
VNVGINQFMPTGSSYIGIDSKLSGYSIWRLILQQETEAIETRTDPVSTLPDPVFITGYMHSATTMTQRVLGRHSQIFTSGGETRHFTHLPEIQGKYPDLDDNQVLRDYIMYLLRVICTGYGRTNYYQAERPSLEVISSCGITVDDVNRLVLQASENRDHAALLGVVYDYLVAREKKKRWLDKSPSYVLIIDDLLARYPNAQVIILVRDPRDILASKLRRSQNRSNYDPVWDTLSWRAAVRAGDAAREKYPQQVICVRYEDLAAEPEQEVSSLCKFLRLKFEPEMLHVDWMNTSIEGLKGSGISNGAIGKWYGTLPEEDVLVCQWLAKEEMVDYGYQPLDVSSSVRFKSPLIIGRSVGNFVARLHKKWLKGGKDHLIHGVDEYLMRFRALNKSNESNG